MNFFACGGLLSCTAALFKFPYSRELLNAENSTLWPCLVVEFHIVGQDRDHAFFSEHFAGHEFFWPKLGPLGLGLG